MANILSIIAIIISIGVPAIEYYKDKKINSINIDIQYYDKVYSEYLLERIPECRLKIEQKYDGTILGVDQFIELLREMRKKSLYFKFANEEFYYEFRRLVQALEDELVLISDKVDKENYRLFRKSIDGKIYQIYECIHKAAHGKKYNKVL
mgnify:CR=1 FL=1